MDFRRVGSGEGAEVDRADACSNGSGVTVDCHMLVLRHGRGGRGTQWIISLASGSFIKSWRFLVLVGSATRPVPCSTSSSRCFMYAPRGRTCQAKMDSPSEVLR